MTETTPMAIMTRAGGEMLGSAGQLIPSTEVSLTDLPYTVTQF